MTPQLIPPGQFLLLAIFLWLSCCDIAFARRKAPTPTDLDKDQNPPWYEPSDFNMTFDDWERFINPPKNYNFLEDPAWYLIHSGYLLRDFSRQQEMMALYLANITADKTWYDFGTQYFKIIAPLTTEWYPIDSPEDGFPQNKQEDCVVSGKKLKNMYKEKVETHPHVDVPPGIMDCGGPMDSSAEVDEPRKGGSIFDPPKWLFRFPDQKYLAFPRDSITVRSMLGNLVSGTPVRHNGKFVLAVSEEVFLKSWHTILIAIGELAAFMIQINEKIANRVIKPRMWPPGMNPIVDLRPHQTRLFRREKIGYEDYFNMKFGGTLSQTLDHLEDPDWINLAAALYRAGEVGGIDLPVAYVNVVNIVYRGVLPLMMDMMADLAVKLNDLSEKYWERPEGEPIPEKYRGKPHLIYSWGFPRYLGFNPTGGTLRKWPEWSEFDYRIEPWPLTQEEIPEGLQKVMFESRIEEGFNFPNPFPWKGTVSQSTPQRSGSTIFLP
ncbi:hypothetical protein TWF730_005866 [Orbilia blumenaviensis]|uniref:Uncharacterized protein n=1 Tax=Orbilia blumenaviensis TaxID=1796055 RepID=A0AAV9VJM8_9PEZI